MLLVKLLMTLFVADALMKLLCSVDAFNGKFVAFLLTTKESIGRVAHNVLPATYYIIFEVVNDVAGADDGGLRQREGALFMKLCCLQRTSERVTRWVDLLMIFRARWSNLGWYESVNRSNLPIKLSGRPPK